jgi:hypothetical protein
MADHAKDCLMAGSYSVTTCPCCGQRITPARRPGPGWLPYQELEYQLRQRCPSGLFDVEGYGDLDEF